MRALSGVMALVLWGCGGGTGSRTDVVGGEEAPDTHPRVLETVALTQDNGRILCSGALLAQGVVLTAAHCLPTLRTVWRPTISFSRRGEASWIPHLQAFNPKVRRIEKATLHQGFEIEAMDDVPTRPPHDIGLVFFRGDTPTPYRNSLLASALGEVGRVFEVMGYGATGTAGEGSGPLRHVGVTFTELFAGIGVLKLGPSAGRGACYGDSGGPIFDETGRVVALVSYGPEEGAHGPDCEQGRFYATDVTFYREWIERNGGLSLETGERRTVETFESRTFAL